MAVLFGDHQAAQRGDIFLEHHRHPAAAKLAQVTAEVVGGRQPLGSADDRLPLGGLLAPLRVHGGRLAGMKRSIQIHEACASGDLGYTQSTVTLQNGGDPAKIVIRGVCIWRREPDGTWRIAHDISNRGEQLHLGEQPREVTISQA